MIKIENTVVPHGEQWKSLILGARNAMNSWDKSDSGWVDFEDWDCGHGIPDGMGNAYVIGNNDIDLMTRLSKAGTDHRKFMRMIVVYADITAPRYWWTEYDTYKIGTVANSCSTMHKIHEKEFTLDDFSHEHLTDVSLGALDALIQVLEANRKMFLALEGKEAKECWWQIIQLLPSSYNQKRTVMLNYEVLANMYHSRNAHKLTEWVDFCKWIKTLPYSEIITLEVKSNGKMDRN